MHLARHLLGDHGEAQDATQDATQDALVLAWRMLATLAEPEAFRAWVSPIVTHRCLNISRGHAADVRS